MTKKGLATIVLGLLGVVTGRLFGIVELVIVGLSLLAIVLFGALIALAPRGRLVPARRLRPQRVSAGQTAHVDIRMQQVGRFSSGLLRLSDDVAGTEGALIHATPMRRNQQRQASYRLPPSVRGVLAVGPLVIERQDPFGLIRRRVAWLDTSELIVHPRHQEIAPPPRPRASDLASAVATPTQVRAGEDFHALRPYEQGDDLRRVHWRATARHDDLMIREHDDSREGRTTILVDVREFTVTPDALEELLSAAASILIAATTRGDDVALLTTDGSGPFEALDRKGLGPLLDALARVSLVRDISTLDRSREALRRSQRSGTLVTLLGAAGVDNESDLATGFQAHLPFRFGKSSTHRHGIVGNFATQWTNLLTERAGLGR